VLIIPNQTCILCRSDQDRKLTGEIWQLQLDTGDCNSNNNTYIYIPLTLYPRMGAEASQVILRDAQVLPILLSYEEYCRRDVVVSPSSSVWSQSILSVWKSFSRLLRHPLAKERGAFHLFCPGHHTRPTCSALWRTE
jgi:hypothetical protein